MIKRGCFFVVIFFFSFFYLIRSDVSVTAQQREKMNILLVLIDEKSEHLPLRGIGEVIRRDLHFTRLFKIKKLLVNIPKSKKDIIRWGKEGYQIVIFVSNDKYDNHTLDVQIYDTSLGVMVSSKKYKKKVGSFRDMAHEIANYLLGALVGQKGSFSTKIAYCKDVKRGKRTIKHIYVADYDGSNAKPIVTTPTINLAPRWNRDLHNPLLFYTESTNINFRLMFADMSGLSGVASNFDGINMLPAFSYDGKRAAYCASRGNGNCKIYYYDGATCVCLTDNQGNNIAPTFSMNADVIYFCSDFPTGKPQIYSYTLSTNKWEQITYGRSCFSPDYSFAQNKLVYTKIINGVTQIFIYDFVIKKHQQLTHDATVKEECCWSPCGNYILFSQENDGISRIANLNMLTGERTFITSSQESCSYPSWSPYYMSFPVVSSANSISTP
jgi:TolB protein